MITYASGQGMSMCLVSECVCRMSQHWHGTPLFSLHRRHMITSSNHMSTMVKSHGTPSIFGQTFHIWSNFPYLVKLSIFGQAFTVPEENYPNVHIVDTHWLTLLLENLPHTFSQVQRILQQCCWRHNSAAKHKDGRYTYSHFLKPAYTILQERMMTSF